MQPLSINYDLLTLYQDNPKKYATKQYQLLVGIVFEGIKNDHDMSRIQKNCTAAINLQQLTKKVLLAPLNMHMPNLLTFIASINLPQVLNHIIERFPTIDINVPSNDGETVFWYTAHFGNWDLLEKMIRHSPHLMITSSGKKTKKTAIDLLCKCDKWHLLELIIDRSATVEWPDQDDFIINRTSWELYTLCKNKTGLLEKILITLPNVKFESSNHGAKINPFFMTSHPITAYCIIRGYSPSRSHSLDRDMENALNHTAEKCIAFFNSWNNSLTNRLPNELKQLFCKKAILVDSDLLALEKYPSQYLNAWLKEKIYRYHQNLAVKEIEVMAKLAFRILRKKNRKAVKQCSKQDVQMIWNRIAAELIAFQQRHPTVQFNHRFRESFFQSLKSYPANDRLFIPSIRSFLEIFVSKN